MRGNAWLKRTYNFIVLNPGCIKKDIISNVKPLTYYKLDNILNTLIQVNSIYAIKIKDVTYFYCFKLQNTLHLYNNVKEKRGKGL